MRMPLLLAMLIGGFQTVGKPIESEHRVGPGGLRGWTVSYVVETISDQGPLPMRLVIARKGRIVRRIEGRGFVWNWMFTGGGKQVAVETGPLHFSLQCVLLDIASGKEVESYDCFSEPLAKNAPLWVKALEAR